MLKGKSHHGTSKQHLISPLDPLTPPVNLDAEIMASEAALLNEAQSIVNSSTKLDKFLLKAKIFKTFLTEKQSGAFTKFFKKLLEYTNALDLAKLKPSDTFYALSK